MKTLKKFKVHQIILTQEEIDKINTSHEGHGAVLKHSLNLDIRYLKEKAGHLAWIGWVMNYYTHVCNILAEDLNGVFEVGNIGPEEQYERFSRMHSVSVGDIIEDENGEKHVVATWGFEKVA
tara:strand:- start:17 stop:382 length:366 start_codon:yes stop_codon:yes gene_type:complete